LSPHPPSRTTDFVRGRLSACGRVGERVLTSSLSRRYPRGIPVGRVARLARDPSGLMQLIEIEPAARMSRLRQVFVVPGPPEMTP